MAHVNALSLEPGLGLDSPPGERAAELSPQTSDGAAPHPERADPNPRDQELSDLAEDWWRRLPPDEQPHALCTRYPRVANRIALCWSDKVLTEQLFGQLIIDRRGGRKGFPREVLVELLKLREFAAHAPMAGSPPLTGHII